MLPYGVIVVVVVVIFPKLTSAFLEVSQFVQFIKGGFPLLSLEQTGFRDTADFVLS